MMTQAVDQDHFVSRARQITTLIPSLLDKRGLIPKFKHWRLVQDSETGMVVLFGVLDNVYITSQTPTRFSDYFDPRLLHELAVELDVPVISSSNDGLRYTFILERGQPNIPKDMCVPAPAFPIETSARNAARQIFSNNLTFRGEHTTMHQRLDCYLKITRAFRAMNAKTASAQSLPDVLFMDEAELNYQMAKYEAAKSSYSQHAE